MLFLKHIKDKLHSLRDYYNCYVYNQGNTLFLVDNFRIEVFEPIAK
ncbi:MAG: hypothetical protein RBS07_02035 [Lentimicrobium sp.]|jgi:hypothetical protein|nr:hypothetical protein [Lentimicrobium sp.]